MMTIINVDDGCIDQWWAQLSACVGSKCLRDINAMWPKISRKVSEGKMKIHWRGKTHNAEHRQTVFICSECGESTWMRYKHPKMFPNMLENAMSFLKVDRKKEGVDLCAVLSSRQIANVFDDHY